MKVLLHENFLRSAEFSNYVSKCSMYRSTEVYKLGKYGETIQFSNFVKQITWIVNPMEFKWISAYGTGSTCKHVMP